MAEADAGDSTGRGPTTWRKVTEGAGLAFRRDGALALILATVATLALSWAWRSRCLTFHWGSSQPQYKQRCYNDMQALYGARGWNDDLLPYVDVFNEYPTLTGLFQYVAALLSHDVGGFYAWNAVLLSLCALATTWILVRAQGARPRQLVWAIGPPLFLYAFHNWDLLAVALATGALVLHARDRPASSGAVMALAGMAKVYPLLFLPLMGMHWLRREGGLGPRSWMFGLAAVGTLVAVNLPFWLADPGLWWQTYSFHAGRDPNHESIWFVLRVWGENGGPAWLVTVAGTGWVDRIVTVSLLAALVGFGTAVWKGTRVSTACLGVLLVFLAFNKVFSIQYALWILPFLALLAVPWSRVFAFIGADALVFWTIWPFFLDGSAGLAPYFAALVLRFIAVIFLLSWVVRQARRPEVGIDAPVVEPMHGEATPRKSAPMRRPGDEAPHPKVPHPSEP